MANKFLDKFMGSKPDSAEVPAKKKRPKIRPRKKKRLLREAIMAEAAQSNNSKLERKQQNKKLEQTTYGDFPRSSGGEVAKQKSKKNQQSDKHWKAISKHLNTQSGSSPWQNNVDLVGGRKRGRRGGKGKQKNKGRLWGLL